MTDRGRIRQGVATGLYVAKEGALTVLVILVAIFPFFGAFRLAANDDVSLAVLALGASFLWMLFWIGFITKVWK